MSELKLQRAVRRPQGGRHVGGFLAGRPGSVARYATAGWLVALLLWAGGSASQAQTAVYSPELPKPPPSGPPPEMKKIESSLAALTNTPIRTVGPGVFQLGQVRLDKAQRTVSFPATLNLAYTNNPLMEYFLVTDYGKAHESVLKTETPPYQVHLAMLLLSGQAGGTNTLQAAPEAQLKSPGKEALPGERVEIQVSWQGADGRPVNRPAGELVYRQDTQATLPQEAWVYNGSAVWNGRFLAQQEGQVISLVTDPVALINSTGAGHDNDHLWFARTNSLPPAGQMLQVTISLSESITTSTATTTPKTASAPKTAPTAAKKKTK